MKKNPCTQFIKNYITILCILKQLTQFILFNNKFVDSLIYLFILLKTIINHIPIQNKNTQTKFIKIQSNV